MPVLTYQAVQKSGINFVTQLTIHKERLEATVLLVVGNVLTYVERYGGTDIIILGKIINATN